MTETVDDPLAPYIKRLFQIESGGNPNATTGSNRGLGQFGPNEERTYGITDANRTDPAVQAAAVAAEHAKNGAALTRALGREPTFADHYLAHQQGLTGAAALFSNPDMPAWRVIRPFYKSDAIAQKAIMGNIPAGNPLRNMDVNDVTAGGFTGMWRDKFNRGLPGAVAGQPETVAAMAAPGATSPGLPAAPPAGGYGTSPAGPPANPLTALANGLIAQAAPGGGVATAPAPAAGATGLAAFGAGTGPGSTADLSKTLMAAAGQHPKFPFPVQPLGPANVGPLKPLPLTLPKFGALT